MFWNLGLIAMCAWSLILCRCSRGLILAGIWSRRWFFISIMGLVSMLRRFGYLIRVSCSALASVLKRYCLFIIFSSLFYRLFLMKYFSGLASLYLFCFEINASSPKYSSSWEDRCCNDYAFREACSLKNKVSNKFIQLSLRELFSFLYLFWEFPFSFRHSFHLYTFFKLKTHYILTILNILYLFDIFFILGHI